MTDISDEALPEWTSEELLILRSADGDKPPGRSLPATLAAVGAGGALASGAAAAKAASIAAGAGSATAKWTTFVALSKWVGLIAIGGALATGSVVLVRRTARSSASAQAVSARAQQIAASPPARNTAPAEPASAPPPEAAVVGPESAVSEASDRTPSGSPARRTPVSSQPDISSEIAALDAARTAIRRGRPSDALAAIDRYRAEYGKNGSLRVEAAVLRIDALLRSGNRPQATALANAFLAHNPKSPYAARVRALMGDAPLSP